MNECGEQRPSCYSVNHFFNILCFRFNSVCVCVIVDRLVEKGVFSPTEFESDESLSDSGEALGCGLFDDYRYSLHRMYFAVLRIIL